MSKIAAERSQKALIELVSQPGNDTCADCKARNPRWASYSLGIFICVNCASIHRKIGTHITKVKSLTLDSWTKEQVDVMKQNGNVKSNTYYNPNEARNPPPTNMMESERDSELEKYIRSKYEYKRFLDRAAIVVSKLGPSRSAASVASSRSSSTPLTASSSVASVAPDVSSSVHNRPSSTQSIPTRAALPSTVAAPVQPAQATPSLPSMPSQSTLPSQYPFPPQLPQFQAPQQPAVPSSNPVWNDLISLQEPSNQASYPLQFQSPQQTAGFTPNATNPYPTQSTGNNTFAGMQTPALINSAGLGMYAFQQQSQMGAVPMLSATPTGFNNNNPNFSYQPPAFQPQSSFGQQFFAQSPVQQTPPPHFQPQQIYPQLQQPLSSSMMNMTSGSPAPFGQAPMQQGIQPQYPLMQQQIQQPSQEFYQPMQQAGSPFTGWAHNSQQQNWS